MKMKNVLVINNICRVTNTNRKLADVVKISYNIYEIYCSVLSLIPAFVEKCGIQKDKVINEKKMY